MTHGRGGMNREGIALYGSRGQTAFPWPDNTDFQEVLKQNGFAAIPQVRIGHNPAESYLTIDVYHRLEYPQCIIDVGDSNGSLALAVDTLEMALEIAARWAPMVTASEAAHSTPSP